MVGFKFIPKEKSKYFSRISPGQFNHENKISILHLVPPNSNVEYLEKPMCIGVGSVGFSELVFS